MGENEFWAAGRLVTATAAQLGQAVLAVVRKPYVFALPLALTACVNPMDVLTGRIGAPPTYDEFDTRAPYYNDPNAGRYYNPRTDPNYAGRLPEPPPPPPVYGDYGNGYGGGYGVPGGYVVESQRCRQRRGLGMLLGPECNQTERQVVTPLDDGSAVIQSQKCRRGSGFFSPERCRGSVTTVTPLVP